MHSAGMEQAGWGTWSSTTLHIASVAFQSDLQKSYRIGHRRMALFDGPQPCPPPNTPINQLLLWWALARQRNRLPLPACTQPCSPCQATHPPLPHPPPSPCFTPPGPGGFNQPANQHTSHPHSAAAATELRPSLVGFSSPSKEFFPSSHPIPSQHNTDRPTDGPVSATRKAI